MGSCSAGSFFPQTKTSNGDRWVHPNLLTPVPSKRRGLEHAERCLTGTYSHVPACSGKLSTCSKHTGELDTLFILTLPYLPDIGFAPLQKHPS